MRLKKTLLALSIMAASNAALALTVDLNGSTFHQGVEDTNLSIFGQYLGDQTAVFLPGLRLSGNFANNATISVEGAQDHFIESVAVEVGGANVQGEFLNSGLLTVNGGKATGIRLFDSILEGGIANNGVIRVYGANHNDFYLGFGGLRNAGLHIENSYARYLNNFNFIQSFGLEAVAIDINYSQVGVIRNNSLLLANGGSSVGLRLGSDTGVLEVINEGSIVAQHDLESGHGLASRGFLMLSGSSIMNFRNQHNAQVSASGVGSIGMHIDGGQITGSIYNAGRISGDQYGILVSNYSEGLHPLVVILDQGGSISGQVAIDGGLKTHLDWYSGMVVGDVRNMTNVLVRGSGLFAGSRMDVLGKVIVMPNGRLELLAPNTQINGDFDLLSDATLKMSLQSTTDTQRGVLGVSGRAYLAAGSRIELDTSLVDFQNGGKTYKLIEAGELVNDGVTVQTSSALLYASLVTPTGYSISPELIPLPPTPQVPTIPTIPTTPVPPTTPEIPQEPAPALPPEPVTPPVQPPIVTTPPEVEVKPNTEAQNRELIARAGGNLNAQVAGARFVTLLGNSNLTDRDPVVASLLSAGQDTKAIARMAALLAPEANGATTQGVMSGQGLVTGAIGGRISGARSGMSSGDGFDQTGGWIQVLQSDASQDMRDGLDGYSTDSKGILFGADGKVNDRVTLGLSYSFVNTDVASDNASKTDVDTHALSAYGSFSEGGFFVDGSLTYGLSHNTAERQLPGAKAKADFDSELFAINIMTGYAHEMASGLIVEPRVAGRYNQVSTNAFQEKSDSAAALRVEAQRTEVLDIGAGLRLAGAFHVAGGRLVPEIKTMAYHDLIGDRADTQATFVAGGDQFTAIGASAARETYEFGLGASYRRDQITMGIGYDRLMKTGFEADTFTAKIRYDF